MFKPQGESLQKVAAHYIGSSALGLFTDLNKANGGPFTPISGSGLRSSFAIRCCQFIQSSVKVGYEEKNVFQVS